MSHQHLVMNEPMRPRMSLSETSFADVHSSLVAVHLTTTSDSFVASSADIPEVVQRGGDAGFA